jgi:flagellar assembly protein FliH
MNTSSSLAAEPSVFISLNYREVSKAANGVSDAETSTRVEYTENPDANEPSLPMREVEKLTEDVRVEVRIATEERMRTEYEQKFVQQSERIEKALSAFAHERNRYFAKAEGEVVHLALAIAAKVLHRESQVDPFLLRAMVKVALEKLESGSTSTLHVAPVDMAAWTGYIEAAMQTHRVTVVEDEQVAPGGCVLRTEMGVMDFSIGAQLKDIEKAFFDLLAQRPIPQ